MLNKIAQPDASEFFRLLPNRASVFTTKFYDPTVT